MTNHTMPSTGFLRIFAISCIVALATSVVLAFGAIIATAGTAQAFQTGRFTIPCYGIHKGEVTKVNCKTGKPISDAQWHKQATKQANNGWYVVFAKPSHNGVFEMALPARFDGQRVTVTAKFTSMSTPEWLDRGGHSSVTTTTRVTGKSITVAIPDEGYTSCWTLRVTVKAEKGASEKTILSGGSGAFTKSDNGYRDITVLP